MYRSLFVFFSGDVEEDDDAIISVANGHRPLMLLRRSEAHTLQERWRACENEWQRNRNDGELHQQRNG